MGNMLFMHTLPTAELMGASKTRIVNVPIRRQSRRVGHQIRTEAPFSWGFFLSALPNRWQRLDMSRREFITLLGGGAAVWEFPPRGNFCPHFRSVYRQIGQVIVRSYRLEVGYDRGQAPPRFQNNYPIGTAAAGAI